MAELKPCPFCGHEAFAEPSKVRKGYECVIQCSGCLACMLSITHDTEEEAEEAAIAAWNRRANDEKA